MSSDDFGCALSVACIGFLILVFVFVIRAFYVDNECTKAGFRDSNVTWTFAAYCVRRVDQTDVVIPLDSARKLAGRKP